MPSCLYAISLMQALFPQVGHGFLEQHFALLMSQVWGGHVPCYGWSLIFATPLHWPGRSLQSQLMRLRTQVELWAHSSWRRGCQCVKDQWLCGGGVAPPMQEVGCIIVWVVWWNGIDGIVCILVLSKWHCLWTPGGQSKFHWEWASLRNRVVLLWVWSWMSSMWFTW